MKQSKETPKTLTSEQLKRLKARILEKYKDLGQLITTCQNEMQASIEDKEPSSALLQEHEQLRNKICTLQAEIQILEQTIRESIIVDDTTKKQTEVEIGSWVNVLLNEPEHGREIEQLLVYLSDDLSERSNEMIAAAYVSSQSNLGASLLGQKVGAKIVYLTPNKILMHATVGQIYGSKCPELLEEEQKHTR